MKGFLKAFLPCILLAIPCATRAQGTFQLFAPEVKTEMPSVVYGFLERYLCELDSLDRAGEPIGQRMRDDKVFLLTGSLKDARAITPQHPFSISKTDDKFYQVTWTDTLGQTLLDVAFPMQYELLLGKPKNEIELDIREAIKASAPYVPRAVPAEVEGNVAEDGCIVSSPSANYYVESLNTARYYTRDSQGQTVPTFHAADKWHSAANLFLGLISDISGYRLYVEQNIYGFQKITYSVTLEQWLAYCQQMQLKVYFAVEEEREDGLMALIVAQSQDLGFNHMLSIILPDNFTEKRDATLKATMNAYIPTQNVKNLYQQYVEKPKKNI